MDLSHLNLPVSVTNNVQFYPYEDILIKMFERGLEGIPFKTYIPEVVGPYPFILGHRFTPQAGWSGDPRFIDTGLIRISVFAAGPNAEDYGVFISEAIRVMMLKAHMDRWHFPGLGSILHIEMRVEPTESTDWATSTGVVQFADLPKGVLRYETVYKMTIRRPSN